MSKFASTSSLSSTRAFCGEVPQSYINTPLYKAESASFKIHHIRRHYREHGVNTRDIAYSPFPPGLFPPTHVSIPHDPSFLITSAFCPRVLSIDDMILPSVTINRILTTPTTLETYDIAATMLVFGDAAITLVKERISPKKPVAVQEAAMVKNCHSAAVEEITIRSSTINFGDAQPISGSNSRFRNATFMSRENILQLSRLASPYRRVINEATNINTSNIVIQAKKPEEQIITPIDVSLRLQNALPSKNHNPTDFGKTVSLSRLTIQPRSSTTCQIRSVFDTGFVRGHRAFIEKNTAKAIKVTKVVDDIGPEIVEDVLIAAENPPKAFMEVKTALVAGVDRKPDVSVQSEVQIITRLSPIEAPSLVDKQIAFVSECAEASMPHSSSQCSVESSQPSAREYSPKNETQMTTDAVGGVKPQPVRDCTTINTKPFTPKYSIRPKGLASACDYARLFDARARSKGVEPPKQPELNHTIPPAIEPQHIMAVNDMQSLQTIRDVARQFDLVPPGTGTPLGPRNDNDWRDIAKIQVMPTIDELLPGRKTVYMPRKERMFPLSRVLDLAFRHYRESSLGPVRDCTADAMARIIQGVGFPSTTTQAAGTTYNVYRNVQVEGCHCTEGRFASLSFSLAFTSPGHEYIAQEKVLRGGHLLALLTLTGVEVEVAWLKAVESWSDRDGYGKISSIGMCILDYLVTFLWH